MKKQILFLTVFVAAILVGMNSYGQAVDSDDAGDYITFPDSPVCITPQILDCANEPGELNPLPGTMYTYTVLTTSDDDDVRWFVFNNNDLVDPDSIINTQGSLMDVVAQPSGDYVDPADGTGSYILRIGDIDPSVTTDNTEYNLDPIADDQIGISFVTGSTTQEHSIDITWKSFNGNTPNEVLLVAVVTDDAGCTNNIEVYRVVPEFNFTLDIAALDNNGDSIGSPIDLWADAAECVSPIESAGYSSVDDVPGNGTLTVDYGENWVFFVVNAANFVDSWMPRFQISHDYGTPGTFGNVDYMTVEWAYANDDFSYTGTAPNTTQAGTQDWHTLTGSGIDWTSPDPVIAGGMLPDYSAEANAVGDGVASAPGTGECIIVRIRLDWGTAVENAVDDVTLSFAVDGVMFDPQEDASSPQADQFDFGNLALKDLGEAAVDGDPCEDDDFDYDNGTYTITPRPQVISNTGLTPEPFELNTGDNDGAGTLTDPNDGTNP